MQEKTQIPYKIYLNENEMPDSWYNIRADMKIKPAPLLNPETHKPCTLEELEHVFCHDLVEQELNEKDALIPIPKEIRDFYRMYRPSPLVRAYCLEKKNLVLQRIFITNLKEIILLEVTNLIQQLLKRIMQKNRD